MLMINDTYIFLNCAYDRKLYIYSYNIIYNYPPSYSNITKNYNNIITMEKQENKLKYYIQSIHSVYFLYFFLFFSFHFVSFSILTSNLIIICFNKL